MRDVKAKKTAVSHGCKASWERIRSGVVAEAPSIAPRFHAYAAQVFARKLALGKIRSAAGPRDTPCVAHVLKAWSGRVAERGDREGEHRRLLEREAAEHAIVEHVDRVALVADRVDLERRADGLADRELLALRAWSSTCSWRSR
jgi:hypothetical protein